MSTQSSTQTESTPRHRPGLDKLDKPDLSEKGGLKEGQPQRSDNRLFMQLLAWGDCADARAVSDVLSKASIDAAVYEEVNDPRGVAIVTLTTEPDFFVGRLRQILLRAPFTALTPKPEFTMLGRTYSLGYEPDLDEAIYHRPRRTVLNKDWPWAVWYPLRRSGQFAQLPEQDQRKILAEHGAIGMAFGAADYAHDIRLACHGLDKNDNDFVIGLIGKDLYPLSAIVQTMRKTQQTSLYLEHLGPFFVGKAIWKSQVNPELVAAPSPSPGQG
jgi:chlorite dismutase